MGTISFMEILGILFKMLMVIIIVQELMVFRNQI